MEVRPSQVGLIHNPKRPIFVPLEHKELRIDNRIKENTIL